MMIAAGAASGLLAQTEGATIAGVVVNGLTEIRKVIFPEENYYVLAADELVSGVLAAREGDTDGELRFLDPEAEPRTEGSSLEGALAEWIVARNSAAIRK